jgi:hypothetical protein
MVSALYNIIGKRIVAVGRPSPNEWEEYPIFMKCRAMLLTLQLAKLSEEV